MKLLILIVVAMLGLAGCVSVGPAATSGSSTKNISPQSCFSGFGTINGVNIHSFCGKATAKVTVGDQIYTFSRGECFNTGSSLGVNIGRIILDDSEDAIALKKQSVYFGVGVKAIMDGTYPGVVTGYDHDRPYIEVAHTSIILSGNLTQGSFTGTSIDGTQAIAGSWACS